MTEKRVKATLAKASDDYLKILAYIQDIPDGEVVEYKAVQRATGVRMDIKGKNKLRRAIMRSKKEYAVIPNVGYKLASPGITMSILTFRLVGIDNKVKRAERAHKVLQQAFFNELPGEAQKGVLFIGSVFGAIRQSAEIGKKLYRKEVKELPQGQPVLPDNI